jgi:hypothetical protein
MSPEPQVETQDVKEVTQGVKEVELEDKDEVEVEVEVEVEDKDKDKDKDDALSRGEELEEQLPANDVEPESVPLPDEDEVDELDDDDGDGSVDDGEEAAAPDPEGAE